MIDRSGRTIRCACGRVLARLLEDCYVIRHRGRELVARDVVSITCDVCGVVWQPCRTITATRDSSVASSGHESD